MLVSSEFGHALPHVAYRHSVKKTDCVCLVGGEFLRCLGTVTKKGAILEALVQSCSK